MSCVVSCVFHLSLDAHQQMEKCDTLPGVHPAVLGGAGVRIMTCFRLSTGWLPKARHLGIFFLQTGNPLSTLVGWKRISSHV